MSKILVLFSFWAFLSPLCIWSFVSLADEATSTTDSADPYEQNLYETYTNYYSKKVSAQEWNNITNNKDTYTIQPKDTLWDISKVLFDDSNYWPKLWSVNPAVANPHLIQPQDILGFVHGTEGTPPYLTMVQKGGAKGSLPQGVGSGQQNQALVRKKSPPVIQIPGSLPPLYSRKTNKQDIDFDIPLSQPKLPAPVSFVPYYMTASPESVAGQVADKKDYGSWFHVGQMVLLEMRESVSLGQKFTVVNNMGKLYSSTLGVRGPFGYQQQVQGEVEIVGRVPDSFDLYEARVTKALNPLSVQSFVVSTKLMEFNHNPTNLAGSGSAQIIGVPTMFSDEKYLASPSDFVYLNRGRGSGLSVGQMYDVTANLSIKTRTRKHGYSIKIGEVKIIHAEDRFATGLVMSMQNAIHVGDYIKPLSQGLSMEKSSTNFIDDDTKVELEPQAQESDDDFSDFEEDQDFNPENNSSSFEEDQALQTPTPTPPPQNKDPLEIDTDDDDVFEAFE